MTNFSDFLNTLGASDMRSLIIILQTYNNDYKIKSNGIEDIGFNTNSGYVWLLLGDGITIVSCFGQSVEFMTIDSRGNEIFHDTYYDAINHKFLV